MARRKHTRARQFTTNSNLIIPGEKPDIDFLLRVTSTPIIEQCVVSPKQMRITGYISICAEYVASVHDGTQPVNFIFSRLPFDETFVHYRARTGMNAYLKCDTNTQHLELTSPREIAISLNVKIAGVKLTRTNNSLPPHHCKPCLVNFFEAGNSHEAVPPYHPEPCFAQLSDQKAPLTK